MKASHGEIAAALTAYFDGFYEGNVDKLKSIFHPACHLYSAPNAELMDSDMDVVYGRVGNRTKPSERGDPKEDGVIATGQSANTDTVLASAMAYVSALNRLLVRRDKMGSGADKREISYKELN